MTFKVIEYHIWSLLFDKLCSKSDFAAPYYICIPSNLLFNDFKTEKRTKKVSLYIRLIKSQKRSKNAFIKSSYIYKEYIIL